MLAYPQMQVLRNQVSITYETFYGDSRNTSWSFLEDLKGIMDGLTKKIKLYKMNNLESFSINLINCQNMSSESFRYLKQNLMKHLPRLKQLALSFYSSNMMSDKGIEAITELILSFKSLESLEIRFFRSDCDQNQHLDHLIKRIHKSHSFIKNLQIGLRDTTFTREYDDMQFIKRDLFEESTYDPSGAIFSYSDQGVSKECALKTIGIITNNFQGLQSLSLVLRTMKEVTDEFCLQLGKGILEKMTCLKHLVLDFWMCERITNNAMLLFSNTPSSKRNLRALEDLTLNFSRNTNISSMGLKKLGEGISQQFKDLKKFFLEIDMRNEVSDEGLAEFNEMITSNLKSLRSYTLTDNMRAKNNAKKISQDIFENLKDLKELCLLHFAKTTGDDLLAISSELEKKKNKQELEKFHIMQIKEDENKICMFFQVWKTTTLKNLIELKLHSSWNAIFNDQVVLELGKALETMTKLKRFAVLLNKCYNIGKNADSSIVPLIPKASVLETFEINLGSCHDITDQHVGEFGANLCQHQKELTLLGLNFAECSNITEKTFQKLCYGIKHDMKEMQHLTMHFENNKIPPKVRREMKMLFTEIPAVAFY